MLIQELLALREANENIFKHFKSCDSCSVPDLGKMSEREINEIGDDPKYNNHATPFEIIAAWVLGAKNTNELVILDPETDDDAADIIDDIEFKRGKKIPQSKAAGYISPMYLGTIAGIKAVEQNEGGPAYMVLKKDVKGLKEDFIFEAKKKKPKCTCDGTEDGDASCKLHGIKEEKWHPKSKPHTNPKDPNYYVLVRCETNKEADAVDSSLAHMEEVHDGVEKILKRVESDEQREDVEMYGHEMRVFTHDGKLNSEMIKHAAAQVEDWGAQAFDDAEKYIDEVNEGAALKRDAGAEGKRQMRIKEILRKLNNGVITKASADKQLRDVGHPGVDLTEEEE